MKLQQLCYVIQVAESGSLTAAAEKLYVAQPSLSKSIAELEREMGITIFTRSRTGVELTEDGERFLSQARQVVEQANLLEAEFKGGEQIRRAFSVSSQHYAFVVNAFVSLVREYGRSRYEFALREGTTSGIIDDVRTLRSELGVLYQSDFNRSVIANEVHRAGLRMESLFSADLHVFVSRDHPLATQTSIDPKDLAPWPLLAYDQGIHNSPYFAEEPHVDAPVEKRIIVKDRATLFNLLIGLNGYTISSGILSRSLNGDQIVSVPLKVRERMELVALRRADRPLSPMASRYLELLDQYVQGYKKGQLS